MDTPDDAAEQHEAVMATLAEMEELFGTGPNEAAFAPMDLLRNVYDYNEGNFSAANAHVIYEECALQSVQVNSWLREHGDPDLALRARVLMRAVQESYSALTALLNWSGDTNGLTMTAEDLVLRFAQSANDKEPAVLTVYKYILSWTKRLQLRHRGDTVYKQIVTRDGHATHAWVVATDVGGFDMSTLEKLVAAITKRSRNEPIWSLKVPTNTKMLTENLRMCLEPEFAVLKTSRCFIAFSDGLYNVYTETFILYEDLDRFGVPSNIAACAYHKVNFAPAFFRDATRVGLPLHPLMELETPLFDKIMITQGLCGWTQFWMMAMVSTTCDI